MMTFRPIMTTCSSMVMMTMSTAFLTIALRFLRSADRDIKFLVIFVISFLIPCMVNTYDPAQDRGSRKIIYCKICASLVFVFEKCKAFAFPTFLIPRKL